MPTLLDILITFLTILIALIPLNKDVILRKELSINKNFWQRITTSGWIVIVFAILIILAVLCKDFYLDAQRATEIREQNAHFDNRLSSNHILDSFQTEQVRVKYSNDLKTARDSIIRSYEGQKKQLEKQIDSLNKSRARHLKPFYDKRLISELNNCIKKSNFSNNVLIEVGAQLGNEEATNFAIEVRDFLIKNRFNVSTKITQMMYDYGGGGFKIGKDGTFILIDVGLITRNGYP